MDNTDFVIMDIETTGLSKDVHKITEIAAVRVRGKRIVDSFESLVNPGVRIPSHIKSLTGITDEMVKDKENIDKVLPRFMSFAENSVFVAHNASFDCGFIRNYCERIGLGFENERVCTRKLANRILPDLGSKKLSSLCRYFNVINEEEHRAMGDVKATYQIFCNFFDMLKERGVRNKEDLLWFESAPARRVNVRSISCR